MICVTLWTKQLRKVIIESIIERSSFGKRAKSQVCYFVLSSCYFRKIFEDLLDIILIIRRSYDLKVESFVTHICYMFHTHS